jgi:LEA14-like dessication related protein
LSSTPTSEKDDIMNTTNRLLAALRTGEQLTARQIASRYAVANPHDLVYKLRSQGYPIYLNECTNSKGEITQKYRLGTPSREMVAVAFAAAGASLMNSKAA